MANEGGTRGADTAGIGRGAVCDIEADEIEVQNRWGGTEDREDREATNRRKRRRKNGKSRGAEPGSQGVSDCSAERSRVPWKRRCGDVEMRCSSCGSWSGERAGLVASSGCIVGVRVCDVCKLRGTRQQASAQWKKERRM